MRLLHSEVSPDGFGATPGDAAEDNGHLFSRFYSRRLPETGLILAHTDSGNGSDAAVFFKFFANPGLQVRRGRSLGTTLVASGWERGI